MLRDKDCASRRQVYGKKAQIFITYIIYLFLLSQKKNHFFLFFSSFYLKTIYNIIFSLFYFFWKNILNATVHYISSLFVFDSKDKIFFPLRRPSFPLRYSFAWSILINKLIDIIIIFFYQKNNKCYISVQLALLFLFQSSFSIYEKEDACVSWENQKIILNKPFSQW